jgi:hypothetical protein
MGARYCLGEDGSEEGREVGFYLGGESRKTY